jgi:hypothetical protein
MRAGAAQQSAADAVNRSPSVAGADGPETIRSGTARGVTQEVGPCMEVWAGHRHALDFGEASVNQGAEPLLSWRHSRRRVGLAL